MNDQTRRQIILVPAPSDQTPDSRKYFDNFVWWVRRALERDQIDAEVLVAEPGKGER